MFRFVFFQINFIYEGAIQNEKPKTKAEKFQNIVEEQETALTRKTIVKSNNSVIKSMLKKLDN